MPYKDPEKRRAATRQRVKAHYARMRETEEGRERLREKERRRPPRASYQREWRKKNESAYRASQERYALKVRLARPPKPEKPAKVPKTGAAPFYDARFDDRLYSRIHALVARGYAADVRDDIISDVYLGVLDGTYPEAVTIEHVRRAAKAALKFAAPRDTVSLDAAIGPDGYTRGRGLGVF